MCVWKRKRLAADLVHPKERSRTAAAHSLLSTVLRVCFQKFVKNVDEFLMLILQFHSFYNSTPFIPPFITLLH